MIWQSDYDTIVIGLGVIGSAATYWLSRLSSKRVAAFEQFELGHSRGASHDYSRIMRLSYHNQHYVRLATQASTAWKELEADAQQQIIHRTGGLDLARPGSAYPLDDFANSLDRCGIELERLNSCEIMKRWPAFELTDDIKGLYQPDAGVVDAKAANAAFVQLARERGAEIRDQSPVTTVRPGHSEIEVQVGGRVLHCRRLILATDAWSNQMLRGFGMQLPMTVTEEQVTYFASPDLNAFQPSRFPIWIWQDEPCFYGFPVFGEAAVKVAQDAGGDAVTPESRTFSTNANSLTRVQDFMKTYMPSALGPILYTKTCQYTHLPNRDILIDSLPGYEGVYLAIGCGHAFKFASVIGKALAELCTYGYTNADIEAFSFRQLGFEPLSV